MCLRMKYGATRHGKWINHWHIADCVMILFQKFIKRISFVYHFINKHPIFIWELKFNELTLRSLILLSIENQTLPRHGHQINLFLLQTPANWATFLLPSNRQTFSPMGWMYALLICGELHETNGRAWFLFQPPLAKMTENLFDSSNHSSFEDAYKAPLNYTPVDWAHKFRCCDVLLYVCLASQLGPCSRFSFGAAKFHSRIYVYLCVRVLAANKYSIMSTMSNQKAFHSF